MENKAMENKRKELSLEGIGAKSLFDLIPETRKQIEEDRKNRIPTSAFFLPHIEPKKLYTIVGTTNSGKTWWSLGTAISMAREGHMVGYITTEDTRYEIVGYLGLMNETEEYLKNVKLVYVEDFTQNELRLLLQMFDSEGYEIVVFDYIRADILDTFDGNLNLTMRQIFKVIRGQLEKLHISIIATVQANAELYRQNLDDVIVNNPDKLFTMIDGGFETAKRSHVVGLLMRKNDVRGIAILKAKYPHNEFVGKVFEYGEVSRYDFTIKYGKAIEYGSFGSGNMGTPKYGKTLNPTR